MPDHDQVGRLASLTVELRDRNQQVETLRRLVEPLRDGNLEAVAGEIGLLDELDEKLKHTFELLAQIPNGNHEDLIGQLDEALNDVAWELAAEMLPELEEKSERQSTLLQQVNIDLKQWESRLNDLTKVVDGARLEGAPFSMLEADLLTTQRAVASIRSAVADRLYAGLASLRETAADKLKHLEASVKKLEPQVARVKKLAKQADLLIMQVPSDDPADYQYRVLFRSADRFLTRGINIIQDVRRLSKADRDWMLDLLRQLTASVNQGLRAAHGSRPAGAARTITPADPAFETATRDAARTLATLGEFMFRMVIPDQMRDSLRNEECSFSITTNDLDLPWELINFDRPDADEPSYLCLERCISRVPLGQVFPQSPPRRPLKADYKRRMLLVHSDPEGNLPAAAAEIDTIANALAGQVELVRVDPPDATNAKLNAILMGRPFDFLHYAGHAYFDNESPDQSGLQLKDGRLTAEKIRLLSKGGSLVFLNACESGMVARDDAPQTVSYLLTNPKPVVGLASAFVYSGALGCVGSLWPIYDKPAADLAVNFYRNILAGEPTGEALRRARAHIRDAYPREITWASYVLYGDPTFRLTES